MTSRHKLLLALAALAVAVLALPAPGQAQLNRVSVNQIIGTLPETKGGTGQSSYTIGDMLYANTATTLSKLAAVASGRILRAAGAATAPAYSTSTYPDTVNAGDVLVASGANAIAGTACAASTVLAGGTPAACTATPTVTSHTASQTALAVTPTDGGVLINTTAATGGATVQMAPRIRFRGNAWDTSASETVDFTIENLPATAATPTGTFRVGYSLNGGAYTYPFSMTSAGAVTFLGSITSTGSGLGVANGASISFSGASRFLSATDKLMLLRDSGSTTGMEFNGGTPTLGTCTGGTLVSGSHNGMGRITGTTGGTCAVNFGTPNYTNAPYCFAIDETAGGIVNTSGESTSTFTISNITSGHAVKFHCDGRIGT